jgi:hypothetical protein
MARQRPVPRPTPEQYHEAWQHRRRDTWPATYDAAMNDPIYGRILRIEAGLIARRHASRPSQTRTTPAPVRTNAPACHAVLDFKRRAAGERDDD